MSAIEKFRRKFNKTVTRKSNPWLEKVPAWTGDYSGVVRTGTIGMIYVRVDGQVIEVYTPNAPAEKNIPVLIGRHRDQPQLWQVISKREVWGDPASASITHHGLQHSFMQPDMTPIDRRQILALTVMVSDAANWIVRVYGGLVHTASGIKRIAHQDIDLSSYVVTAGAKYINIESDDDGALTVNEGSVFGSPQSASVTDIPTPASGKYIIATILIYENQTLSNYDIVIPMALPGTAGGWSHDPVTLGLSSNGLSITGQVLSLGLASAGVAGALSGTDWSTFNSKQAALTLPLAANLGGTGIANAAGSTLTLGAATSITGGGTLALAGYTLTVPASLTAAGLAIGNVFTTTQTITPSSDVVGQIINVSATANALQVKSGSSILFGVDNLGGISNSYSFTGTGSANANYFYAVRASSTPGGGTLAGARYETRFYGSGAYGGLNALSLKTGTYVSSSGELSYLDAIVIADGDWYHNGSGALYYARGIYISAFVKGAGAGYVGTVYGIKIAGQTAGSTNYAIYTDAGLNRIGDQISVVGSANRTQLQVTGYTTQTSPVTHIIDNQATNNAVREVMRLETRVSSTDVGAAGFGSALTWYGESATNGNYRQMGQVDYSWVVATDASRTARGTFYAYDTAARECIRVETSGTAPMLGFYGGAAVVRGAALTAQLTTITYTAPGTPDYAIQDMTQASPWGFATQDEGNSVLAVIANLQTRVAELEARLGSATGVNLFA